MKIVIFLGIPRILLSDLMVLHVIYWFFFRVLVLSFFVRRRGSSLRKLILFRDVSRCVLDTKRQRLKDKEVLSQSPNEVSENGVSCHSFSSLCEWRSLFLKRFFFSRRLDRCYRYLPIEASQEEEMRIPGWREKSKEACWDKRWESIWCEEIIMFSRENSMLNLKGIFKSYEFLPKQVVNY